MLFLQRLMLLLPWRRAARAQSLEEELRVHEELSRADGEIPQGSPGLRPIACGWLVGLAGAAACGRLLSGLLFGVSPLDAVTLVSVALLLGAAGVLASWLPGPAVARVDPATVLRYE